MSGFESGELPNSSALVPVLARLLEFTPADLRNIRAARRRSWLDGLPALSNPATIRLSSEPVPPSADGRPPVAAAPARSLAGGMFSSSGTGNNSGSGAAATQRT